VDNKFNAKLAPWPYGHYNPTFVDNLDDAMDDMNTEDFEDASFSQVGTEDYTTASFQHQPSMCCAFSLCVNWLMIYRLRLSA
jgi:hypothetical protein